ncbi:MAG: right-handed parallel beta-helix repeat-containing protein [Actinomycetota bacterium]|nr:right-handed parallel beta-helix repeat-containing protein [Actinomycetota bacterium]
MERRFFFANASALLCAAGLAPTAGTPALADPGAATPTPSETLQGPDPQPPGTPAWCDVTTHGASPSATPAENDAALAAAVAAIPPAGGVLYLPTGTYKISQALTLGTNTLVQGDGMNATVLHQTSTTANGITLTGTGPRYVALRDLKLQGPRSGSGIGVQLTTTTTSAVASCDLSRLYIKDFGGAGVSTNILITSTLTDLRVQGCGTGFHLLSGTSVALTACYALSCRGPGYHLDAVTYSTLVNCACDNCPVGYHLAGSRNISLVACGCERAAQTSYLVEAGSSNSLLNCYSSGAGAVAFRIAGGSAAATLLGVRETAPTDTTTASIQVEEGSTAFVLGPSAVSPTRYAPNTTGQWTPTDLTVASPSTATACLERSGTTEAAAYTLATAGTARWSLGLSPDSTDDLHLRNTRGPLTAILAEDRSEQPNLQLLSPTKAFGGGVGVIGIANSRKAPTRAPEGGGILYVERGALKYRGSTGTVTRIARA